MLKLIPFLTLIYLIPLNLEAKIFKNSYVSFELPTNWDCSPHDTEWVCHEKNKIKGNEAIIVIVAKEKGSSDNLASYTNYLKKPKNLKIRTKSGFNTKTSKVNYVRKVKISNQDWVDGMHFTSEADAYFTRYLATVTPQLGILFSLTVHKDAYSKYGKTFSKAVNSLKVNRLSQGQMPRLARQYKKNLPRHSIHQKRKHLFDEDNEDSSLEDENEQLSSRSWALNQNSLIKILGGLLLLGAFAFLFLKMRKN